MATATGNNEKLRVLLIPLCATSHIQPFTELAISLATANEDVEATVAVTPANVSIVQSLLDHRGHNSAAVKIATYPFPTVHGIPKGVENFGKAATPEESSRILAASLSEAVMRPAQETLIRAQSPDTIVNDVTFLWNSGIADELSVPCVTFSVIGAFPMLAMRHIADDLGMEEEDDQKKNDDAVVVPRFPVPCIRIPRTELPDFLRKKEYAFCKSFFSLHSNCFGFAMNTWSELETQYCEMYRRGGYVKRAYFLGPLALGSSSSSSSSPSPAACADSERIIGWLDSKPDRSVVYISFGTMAHIKDAQLDELALGLETSEKSFLLVVRGKEKWSPPKGWEERVQDQDMGLIIRAWAPQTAILGHQAVGAFVTQCGWNSILESVAAGVPLLTWPILYEQFITERLVTDVLAIGERLWPYGAGMRSETYQEHEVIPALDVAQALTTFMNPGGPGDVARSKVMELAAKARAAVAEGGSSRRDLHRLVHDLMAAKSKGS